MMDLHGLARSSGVPFDTLRRWMRRDLLSSSENLGRGPGNGYRFTARDALAVRVLRALSRTRATMAAAGRAIRALQSTDAGLSDLCLIICPLAPGKSTAVPASGPLPEDALSEAVVTIVRPAKLLGTEGSAS